jgi:hypothetical protein
MKFPCRQPTTGSHFVVNGSEYTHVQSQVSAKENGGRAEGNGIASIDQCLEIQTDQEECLGKIWGSVALKKL